MTLLDGPVVKGTVVGSHELRFRGYEVAITAPGFARMPNGIQCRIALRPTSRVYIGRGRLMVGRDEITPGPGWDPVPVFEPLACLPAGLPPAMGSGHSATVLAGYVAGLVLLHGLHRKADQVATAAMSGEGPAGVTQLRHAALGEVPEPVHELLAARNASALITWSPSGISWLRGFLSAGLPIDLANAQVAVAGRTA